MSRLAERYTRKANSGASGVGRQSRPAEAAARAGGRHSAVTRRQPTASSVRVSGPSAERHDWLVPLELP